MIRLKAAYRIKAGTYDAVRAAIIEFVTAVHEVEMDTEYAAFRIGDTDDFIHLMAFVDEAAQKRHQEAPYTIHFVEKLYPNCVEMPVFTQLNRIE